MGKKENKAMLESEEEPMPDNSKASSYILVGREDTKTVLARKMLNEAGVAYRFAYADVSEGPLPQLLGGLNTFIGLEQISRVVARVRRNHRPG
ncbi:MAG: hypothetical protein A2Z25_07990 [Planctomycetes bacterium RBG_16_55_9]|nr:MAG: hypothetical protein A2Z25_07990 [Planctomycetes bacterium RBG_16_55_9]